MVLDDNNMLQADATLLAGFLILLTLLSFRGARMARPDVPEMSKELTEYLRAAKIQKEIRNTLSWVTIGGIIPFSVSAIFIIVGSMDLWAKIAMILGLAYLIVAAILMVWAYRKAQKLPVQHT
jgi:hypothetical protein